MKLPLLFDNGVDNGVAFILSFINAAVDSYKIDFYHNPFV